MEPLDPKVIILFFIKNILGTIYVIPIWWIGVSIFGAIWAPPPDLLPKAQVLLLLDGAGIIYLILLILGCYYWAWLTFSRYSFNLENDGLHIYQGVLIRRHIMIPYNSIQAVEVYINPLVMRFLRLYYLHIKTHDVENTTGILHHHSEVQLPGMSPEVINRLRGQLIASSHILATKPRQYFDPVSGRFR